MVYFLIQQVIFQFIPFPKAISESPELEEPLWLADTGAGGGGQSGNPRGLPAERVKFLSGVLYVYTALPRTGSPIPTF